MQKKIIIVSIIVVLIIGNLLQFAQNYSVLPRNAVPDEETAIKIAQAAFSEYFEPTYHQSAGYLYWGFEADFNRLRGIWTVSTYPISEFSLMSFRTSIITIRMRDAKIMNFRIR